jgi:hypothetical protein
MSGCSRSLSACHAGGLVDQPIDQLVSPDDHHPLVPREEGLAERPDLRTGDEPSEVDGLAAGQSVEAGLGDCKIALENQVPGGRVLVGSRGVGIGQLGPGVHPELPVGATQV